jgi:hypothetical protein
VKLVHRETEHPCGAARVFSLAVGGFASISTEGDSMSLRLASLVAVLASACTLNESGNVSSTKTGDTSHPAERRSPLTEVRAACGGAGEVTDYGATVLQRAPYLQQVTGQSAIVGWVTSQPERAMVELGPVGGQVAKTAASVDTVQVRTAGEHQMWTAVEALQPGTIYCYSLADARGEITSPTGFRSAPAADSPEPVRFLAFGDSGSGTSDQYALAQQMYTVPFDMMLHTGDIAYDNGSISQYEDNVFGVYADFFRNIPFFPSAGNHDYQTLQGAPFRDVFNLPGQEKWYSYDYGRVHFAALDTESSYAEQARWLDEDLAATTLPWKIVYMHRPPYSSGNHGSDTSLRAALAPILERHGVQLVLAGHDHDYERTKSINGTTYVVTGGGGRGTYKVDSSSFTELSVAVIHFVYGEVTEHEMVLHAIDGTGREFDSVVIPAIAARTE